MKETEEKIAPGEALDEIRELMNRSTRSYLSGWAPLLCGVVAILGGFLLCRLNGYMVAGVTLALGILVPFLFTLERAKREGVKLSFNTKNRRLAETLFLPVFIGGVMCIAMVLGGAYEWLAPVMLCFYGLAVFNLSKCSEATLVWPGAAFIVIGLVTCFFRQSGLELWILGFGGVHVFYGVFLIFKNRG